MKDYLKVLERARKREQVARLIAGTALAFIVFTILAIIGVIIYKGAASISWDFLFTMPSNQMTAGGIWPALYGTLMLIVITGCAALPLGIATGIFLTEYAGKSRGVKALRLAIANMAGIPSVIYGLFGYAAFSLALGFEKSLLAMGLTLACVTLPLIITTTEEALKQVPLELRNASLALGATRWRTTYRIVLPAALPGIVTGAILSLSRAAGETAPILFTGVAFFAAVPQTIMQPSMALPYHLYIMATQPTTPAPHIVWGTALVLVGLLCIINAFGALWRARRRRKISW